MASTSVTVHEYGCKNKLYAVVKGVPVLDSVWDSCVDALSGYKSQQRDLSIAKPGRWSEPGVNIQNQAVSQQWNKLFKSKPHVHAGADWRAVIGCRVQKAPDGKTYSAMSIYIGEFGTA
jgi:hypothetical protein